MAAARGQSTFRGRLVVVDTNMFVPVRAEAYASFGTRILNGELDTRMRSGGYGFNPRMLYGSGRRR